MQVIAYYGMRTTVEMSRRLPRRHAHRLAGVDHVAHGPLAGPDPAVGL